MPPPLLDALALEAARNAEVLIVEGVMGLFDGVPGPRGRTGATADIAARFGLPVLLVLDVSGQSQTAAAVVRGLASHDADVRIAGVVLNRVGSERHRALVADAIAALACRCSARCRATPRSRCRSGIWGSCRRTSTPTSRRGSTASPPWRSAISISTGSPPWRRR